MRRQFRTFVEKWFPEPSALIKGSYGVRPFKTDAAARAFDNPAQQVVVLIHGLDDPEMRPKARFSNASGVIMVQAVRLAPAAAGRINRFASSAPVPVAC